MGTNTDPYQPTERRLGITRQILEVLSAHDHPLGLVTKNALVLRDLDLLASMAERDLVQRVAVGDHPRPAPRRGHGAAGVARRPGASTPCAAWPTPGSRSACSPPR